MRVYAWYPIRCSSCNKHIGNIGNDIRQRLENGHSLSDMFESDYKSLRVCCKVALMSPSPYNLGGQDENAVYRSRPDGSLPEASAEEREGDGCMRLVESRRFPGMFIGERTDRPAAEYEAKAAEKPDEMDEDDSEQLVVLSGAPQSSEQVPRIPGVPSIDSTHLDYYSSERKGELELRFLLGRAYLAV